MGTWGTEPWDNDAAADFFQELWKVAPVSDPVQAALRSADGREVVAALWLCSFLCQSYVWPHQTYEATLLEAIAAADRLLAGEDEMEYLDEWDDPTVRTRVEEFRSVLVARNVF